MWLFPTLEADPLDAESLPPTGGTELNYRTRPLSPQLERRLTLIALLAPAPILISLAAGFAWFFSWHILVENVALGACVVLAVRLVVKNAVGARIRRDLTATWVVAGGTGLALVWRLTERVESYLPLAAVILAWFTSVLMARQVAAWFLASPRVDSDTAARWRVNLPGFWPRGLSFDCPELLTFYLSPLFIGGAWWLAVTCAEQVFGCPWAWPACFLCMVHLITTVWHMLGIVPWPDFGKSWKASWDALVVFVTYDVHQTPAAGVFRFPSRWLRPISSRWGLLALVLLVLGFGSVSACPDPAQTFRASGSYFEQIVINVAIIGVSAPFVFLVIFWETAGSLLLRFQSALDSEDSLAVSNASTWDNYLDRIVNSSDPLEREHFFMGASVVGDYPVLLHGDILDQHYHMVGDTGCSKTSLGIAPLATQIIARGDSTVLMIDLKGDKALFETCRLEAQRTRRLPFRWLNNEVGKSTFAFNPLLQSHNRMLSPEQLTQEILQGLSLDYGVGYGKGYYTSMNETVLKNLFRHCPIRSFAELSPYLEDKTFYKTIGNLDDWKEARHLAALVNRLAAVEAINVAPGTFPHDPHVLEQAIDARSLFDEPQVAYLWLRSPQEPTGAPTIARLFLWALFTAASHGGDAKHRVYIFIDEFQQIISEGMKLIFEQFRDLGATVIAAHQTVGQLQRQGTDLGETIESCTAVKQVYRASDVESLKRIEYLGGRRSELVPTWIQPWETGTGDLIDRLDVVHAEDGLVRVKGEDKPNVDIRRLQKVSSSRFGSVIRFTFGSGYTQFAGATVPMFSQYPISFEEYKRRRRLPWPSARGAFVVPAPKTVVSGSTAATVPQIQPVSAAGASEEGFVEEFERRAQKASGESAEPV